MPNTREKLIELLKNNREKYLATYIIKHRKSYEEYTADHLIANGVTFQTRDIHWATEQAYKNGYAKAVKEFADRLEEKYENIPMWGAVAVVYMEQILKEMVGAEPPKGE